VIGRIVSTLYINRLVDSTMLQELPQASGTRA